MSVETRKSNIWRGNEYATLQSNGEIYCFTEKECKAIDRRLSRLYELMSIESALKLCVCTIIYDHRHELDRLEEELNKIEKEESPKICPPDSNLLEITKNILKQQQDILFSNFELLKKFTTPILKSENLNDYP